MALVSQGWRLQQTRSRSVRSLVDHVMVIARALTLCVNGGGSEPRDASMADVEAHIVRARRYRERFEERYHHGMYMTWR